MRVPEESALRTNPDVAAHTAAGLVTAADVLDAAARPLLAGLEVPPEAYGSTPGATGLAAAFALSTAGAEAAVHGLAAAIRTHADRLYGAAFGFASADHVAAAGLARAGRWRDHGPPA